MIDTSKEVIKIKLTSPSGETRETKVYTRFTLDARSRVVQAICDLVGGTVVYFRFKSDNEEGCHITVPVFDRRSPTMIGNTQRSSGYLSSLTRAFDARGSAMTIFGESRVEWTLETESLDESDTELDYGPEHSDDPSFAEDSTKDGNLAAEFF